MIIRIGDGEKEEGEGEREKENGRSEQECAVDARKCFMRKAAFAFARLRLSKASTR